MGTSLGVIFRCNYFLETPLTDLEKTLKTIDIIASSVVGHCYKND